MDTITEPTLVLAEDNQAIQKGKWLSDRVINASYELRVSLHICNALMMCCELTNLSASSSVTMSETRDLGRLPGTWLSGRVESTTSVSNK